MAILSIIIPTYNRFTLVKATLDSIKVQSYSIFECLIVDDNSSDGTWELLTDFCKSDHRFKALRKPSHLPKGPSSSRNLGLSLASGKWVHFFDSDDLLLPDFYANCVEILDGRDSDFLAVRIRWFSDEDHVGLLSPELSEPYFIEKAITREHEIWTQNVIWRRDLLERSPKFDELLTMSEDILFAVEVISNANRYSINNQLHVAVRRHSQSLTYQDTPERNIVRQRSVFVAYYRIFQLIHKREDTNADATKYCLLKMYQSLSKLYEMKDFHTINIKRIFQVACTSLKLRDWRLFLKTLVLIPIKPAIRFIRK